jgi:hypothetical protein
MEGKQASHVKVATAKSCVDLCRSTVAAHSYWAHDRLQAGDVADLRLYDCSGANYDRFGLFRDGNAKASRGLKRRAPSVEP